MVLTGAYNAVVRYLSGFARVEPSGLPGMALRQIGELALLLNTNMFIELQWYLFSLLFLLGAAYALKEGAHVRVDVLYQRLSVRGKAWVDVIGAAAFLLPFCALMIASSWPIVAASWAVWEVSPDPGGLPRYPLVTIIPLAFILLAAQGTAQLVRCIAVLRDTAGG